MITDVCDGYAEHDDGLGLGNWPIDAAPLPHPFCTCLWYVDTDKTLDEIGRELRSWADGEREDERLDKAFGEWEQDATSIDIESPRGIMEMDNRSMAGGRRQPALYILDEDDIAEIMADIRAIGADEDVFIFNVRAQTGYVDSIDKIFIRGDIYPDMQSVHPRDQMSVRAVLGHEYYGHRPFRGTKLEPGSWNDEFRASYRAAVDTPNLTQNDRRLLILDAIERAKEANIAIKQNATMRRLLYGEYE